MRSVHIVLPDDIDDPASPSGGNIYDRRICDGLRSHWAVHEHAVPGPWPSGDPSELAKVLAGLPDGALVLIDGLIASAVPEIVVRVASRLRLVVLVHMPFVTPGEGEMLAAVQAVLTTSAWTRDRLLDLYAVSPNRVSHAVPGVDAADLAPGTADGTQLLCVAAVTPQKGHDVLLSALSSMDDVSWDCVCVGSLDRDPEFAASMRASSARVSFAGTLIGSALEARYAAADLLVLPSRGETYGMVVTEALARGLPVLATDAGGVSEALGYAPGGRRPGLLVPPDDPEALADALRRWLAAADLRMWLRRAAADRRGELAGWDATVAVVDSTLSNVALQPVGSSSASDEASRVSVSR